MATYIEYELSDQTSILIETHEAETGGLIKAGRSEDSIIIKAKKKFSEALDGIQLQAQEFASKLRPTEANEIEIKFSLKSTGELGNFAVGGVGIEAAYEVTLKWRKPEISKEASPAQSAGI